jgi:hypothetical protein
MIEGGYFIRLASPVAQSEVDSYCGNLVVINNGSEERNGAKRGL